MVVRIAGKHMYLWRDVDHEGEVLDMLVQRRRDKRAALRLVRVDNGWKVTEKDDANGYLLFDYTSPGGGKSNPGTMELVRGHDPDAAVSVLIQLPAMPQYHEQVLLNALATKMRREYGAPPVHRKADPVAPDAGPDAPAE